MTIPEDFSEESWLEMIDEETHRIPGERDRIASAIEAFLAMTDDDVPFNELFAGLTPHEMADVGSLLTCLELNDEGRTILPSFRAGGWPAAFQEPPGSSSQRRLS